MHQRKGIGRTLVQWGMDLAAKEERDILLFASPTGQLLYKKMGFEEIGEVELFEGELRQLEKIYRMKYSH